MRRRILITGALTGIGRAGAEELGRRGWTVLVHGRTEARSRQACAELAGQGGAGAFEPVWGDLADLRQVEALAAQVGERTDRLDVLWHNAGVMVTDRRTSADGFELQWAVNHLAGWKLVAALLPLVPASDRTEDRGRIVLTSSFAHHMGSVPASSEVFRTGGRRKYNGWLTYGDTKLANRLTAVEVAGRTGGRVAVHAFHPGYVRTSFGANGDPTGGNAAHWTAFAQIPVAAGAETGVFLVESEAAGRTSGLYWSSKRVRRGSGKVTAGAARKLAGLTDSVL